MPNFIRRTSFQLICGPPLRFFFARLGGAAQASKKEKSKASLRKSYVPLAFHYRRST